jgi:hypothetical protein
MARYRPAAFNTQVTGAANDLPQPVQTPLLCNTTILICR